MPRSRRCEAAANGAGEELRVALLPKDAMDERNVILEIRAGTGGDEAALFAGDLFRMYERYAADAGLEGRGRRRERRHGGRLQGNRRRDQRPRRLRQAEIRIRRASRAARAGHRGAGPHPHLGRDRRGAAGGRGGRHRDQRRRSEDRHHAGAGRRRPARQQDRIGDPHHPSADRHRGRRAGGALAAQEPRQGDGAAARQALRRRAQPSSMPRAPPTGAARSAPATAPSASAPTISRKAASPTTASTSRSTSCRR